MFLVHSRFVEPQLDFAEIAEIHRREATVATALQNDGTLLHLWREAGTRNAWGVWNAANENELADILSSLPWSPHMTFETFPIIDHPNSVRAEFPSSPTKDD